MTDVLSKRQIRPKRPIGEGADVRRVAVLGAGAWGTALAIALARQGLEVRLWSRRADHALAMSRDRENGDRLSGCPFPAELEPTHSMEAALAGADLVLLAAPSGAVEGLAGRARAFVGDDVPVLVCAKGLAGDGTLLSRRVAAKWQSGPVLILSGPSFADEVAQDLPTIVSLAGEMPLAASLAERLSRGRFMLSPTNDVVGVQVAGVFKNVAATLCGASDGLNLGANARAAILSEAVREASSLIVALGGCIETLLGPAGFGDFVLTCTDAKSRNYRYGLQLAKPKSASSGASETHEGAANVEALIRMAARVGLKLPLAEAVAALVSGRLDARGATEAAFEGRCTDAIVLAEAG
ncbi:NAD(P)H-dependent glycerol-3-phosphate dehydrogenase [Hyphomicrobium sp. NDB2Meth4]|uniref:NAD(P)H-dependent glycerol-3-phosphate dehydrogenase n=1 Tax=Hyphomicrobium sp. NDB2Meth4 TaxID=1892846 RepID=UPI0015C54BF1|nr:NAD(P)H-dependent glycerol-3-phosphate dehydrogenase [Hyphomicrobium sp. NDB2Meth4]